jgi:ribokinase
MSVLVLGSLNLDLVAYAQKLPALGQTVTGEKLLRFAGGKGFNQAIAASRAGAQVIMAGALGKDNEGDFLFKILQQEQIDSRFISRLEIQTGLAVIEVSADAQNRILIIPGANSAVKFDPKFLTIPELPRVCLAQLETPLTEVKKFIINAKQAGSITIFNPAPIQELDSEILSCCDYLIVNESEASFLIESMLEKLTIDQAREIGQKLLAKGARAVVITLAENGSIYLSKNNEIYTTAYKVSAVDTTAAGDAFCGAFATALSEDNSIEYALKFASAAGALAATKAGAVPSLPNSDQILSMIASVQ